jgi:2'-5' RNA ligase
MGHQREASTEVLVYFAMKPDHEAAARIHDLAHRLRTGHELTGTPVARGQLHATLEPIRHARLPPQEQIALAAELAGRIVMPAFRVEFDRVLSLPTGRSCCVVAMVSRDWKSCDKNFAMNLGSWAFCHLVRSTFRI